ncbi:MAG: hypothetical protein C5B48_09875 [Candidatus Rokuibacteriota bacterium]|nr:MAG: hypothetical protein C5B48_09875 [Candidatus Rokubacteria bacterium]
MSGVNGGRTLALSLGLVLAAAVGIAGSGGVAAPSRPNDLREAVGAYRFADGSAVALVLDDSGASLRLVDYSSGALRDLVEVRPDELVGGPGVRQLRPVRVRIRLERGPGGEVVALRRGGREARRIPLVAEPASFDDGAIRLAGRLLRPTGSGPFPAVVLVPGGVPARRDTYDLWAFFFASQGLAVLSYDHRGVGASTGLYVKAPEEGNLSNLADDALAAVRWLRSRPDVDPGRIGLSGGSQAGLVIPLAASRSSDVGFATIQSGPVTSVARQQAYDTLTLAGARVPPPTGQEIRSALDQVPDGGFDPRPALAALRIPVLWQLGSVDKRAFTPETLARLATITASGDHDFTVRVYAGGAHSLRLTRHGLISEELRSPGFVPGLFGDLAGWLASRLRP